MSELTAKEQAGIRMVEIVYILTVVRVAQWYVFVKTHSTIDTGEFYCM